MQSLFAFVYSGGTYTTIDVPGSTSAYVTGINASGVVAGDYTSGSTEFGFVDSGGTYTTIDVAGSTDTYVEGINNSGQVTGYYLRFRHFRLHRDAASQRPSC